MKLRLITLLLSVFMKVINNLGNEYKGTLGKSVTAAKWKGRNYFKKHFKPANPNTEKQQSTRTAFKVAVNKWHDFDYRQKMAYGFFERYRKLQVSPFNAMIGSYINVTISALGVYTAPSFDKIGTYEVVTGNPITGALVIIKKVGQATEYARGYTNADALWYLGLCKEDENYDIYITAAGYEAFFQGNQDKDAILHNYELTPL